MQKSKSYKIKQNTQLNQPANPGGGVWLKQLNSPEEGPAQRALHGVLGHSWRCIPVSWPSGCPGRPTGVPWLLGNLGIPRFCHQQKWLHVLVFIESSAPALQNAGKSGQSVPGNTEIPPRLLLLCLLYFGCIFAEHLRLVSCNDCSQFMHYTNLLFVLQEGSSSPGSMAGTPKPNPNPPQTALAPPRP